MITNILLGLILGVVITSFVILNNKINRTEFNTKFIIDALKRINQFIEANNFVINNIQDKINNKVLKDNEHFEIIKDLIEKNKVEMYNIQQTLYNFPIRLETFIVEENNAIRNEIKKQAKISSKINSKTKTSKSINK